MKIFSPENRKGDWYKSEYDNMHAEGEELNSFHSLNSEDKTDNIPRLQHCTWHDVKHQYRDHYDDPEEKIRDMVSKTQNRKGPRGGVMAPFPAKLHALLSEVEEEGIMDVISWQPHGRCFMIHQTERFVEEIMPRYFKQSKFTSFQRQVNLYGFRRLLKGADHGGYYHEFFLRGRSDLCSRIIRTKVKGIGIKTPAPPNTEPDFYSMKPCSKPASCTTVKTCEQNSLEQNISTHTAMGKDAFCIQLTQEQKVKEDTTDMQAQTSLDDYISRTKVTNVVPTTPMLSLQSLAASVSKRKPIVSALASSPSPPSSTSSRKTQTSSSIPCEWSAPVDRTLQHDRSSVSSSRTKSLTLQLPNPGERIFFEGCSFHYLDTISIKDLRG